MAGFSSYLDKTLLPLPDDYAFRGRRPRHLAQVLASEKKGLLEARTYENDLIQHSATAPKSHIPRGRGWDYGISEIGADIRSGCGMLVVT